MDPVEYLFGLETRGIKFGLDNIRALCRALDDPQDRYRSIIIAGTNGKGSVAALVDSVLSAAGYCTGRYTSPHLSRLEERFAIDGRPVTHDALAGAAADLRATVDRLRARGALQAEPTFFEATTAVAFELFRRAGVDLAILEVGLGGRLDATNIASPMAAAITSIALDHQEFLGSSIPEIAREKAGVIKPGMIVVAGRLPPEAQGVMEEICLAQGAELVEAEADVRADIDLIEGRVILTLETPVDRYGPVALGLRGRHQARNAIVCVRLLEAARRLGVAAGRTAIERGLRQVSWPGRLELMAIGDRQVLLDAAHNPDGTTALAAYLREVYPDRMPIVFGVMRDKDAAGMLRALAPCASCFVFTQARPARAAPAAALADLAREVAPHVPAEIAPNPPAALARALAAGSPVCVAGSLFLVGEVRAHLEARGRAPAVGPAA